MSTPELERIALKYMRLSENTFVRDQAAAVLKAGKGNEEMFSIRNQIRVSSGKVFGDPAALDYLSETNFDLLDMRRERMTVFFVLPGHAASTHNKLLRAALMMLLGLLEEDGVCQPGDGKRPILIQIDEFPVMDRMKYVVDGLARFRAHRVQFHLLVQGLSQLEMLYGKSWTSIAANVGLLAYAGGTNDRFTANQISERCGVRTGVKRDVGQGGKPGDSGSQHYSTYGIPNFLPDQIERYPMPKQLMMPSGQNPVECYLFEPALNEAFPGYVAFMRAIENGYPVSVATRVAEVVAGSPETHAA